MTYFVSCVIPLQPFSYSLYFFELQCKKFKQSCQTDADCTCPGKHMICETEPGGMDAECVLRDKRTLFPAKPRKHTQSKKSMRRDSIDWYEFFNL